MKFRFCFTIVILLGLFSFRGDFLSDQFKHERVRKAVKEKSALLDQRLADMDLSRSNLNLLVVAYKHESQLELYVKSKSSGTYSLLTIYNVCARSGSPGPKRKQGDGQVPEGLYHIERFNPNSAYYLSLGINYPNTADRIRAGKNHPGGDIFIHGSCLTIGCLPMTDDKIKEIYLYAVFARAAGQSKIPVYIFPYRMTEENMTTFRRQYLHKPELLTFWAGLQPFYQRFQEKKTALNFKINEKGDYTF